MVGFLRAPHTTRKRKSLDAKSHEKLVLTLTEIHIPSGGFCCKGHACTGNLSNGNGGFLKTESYR